MQDKSKTELMIQISYKCNLNCIHCAYGDIRDLKPPDTEYPPFDFQFYQKYNPKLVKISGGEPCLDPDLPGIVRTAKNWSEKVIVFTNGTLESEARPDAWWVTLYGSRRHHNRITRADTFDKTIAFIKSHDNIAYLNSPVFNRQQLKSLKEMGEKLDIPLRIVRLIPHGNMTKVLGIERQQKLVTSLKLNRKPNWITCSLGFEPSRCWKKVCLKPDGTEVICTALVRGLQCPFRKKIPALLWNELFKK